MENEKFNLKIPFGNFWISPNDLPNNEPLRSIMVDILACDPESCRDKSVFLGLVEEAANEIILKLK